jgi:hypothetical protein
MPIKAPHSTRRVGGRFGVFSFRSGILAFDTARLRAGNLALALGGGVTHQEKVAQFERLLRDRGYWKSNAIPPACQLLWRLGFKTPPPYFLSFPIGMLSAGLPFGVLWGVFMWLFVWPDDMSLPSAVLSALLAGTFFGFLVAIFWRLQARSLSLPAWDKFSQEPESTA